MFIRANNSFRKATKFQQVIVLTGISFFWPSGASGTMFDVVANIKSPVPGGFFGSAIDGDAGSGQVLISGLATRAVYHYDLDTQERVQTYISDEMHNNDGFGRVFDASGNLLLVSSMWHDDPGPDSGSAYLFDIQTGEQLHKLQPDDIGGDSYFGQAVAIDGNVALINAWNFQNEFGDGGGTVYQYDTLTGDLIRKLEPGDGVPYQGLGSSLAIHNGVAIVGTRGFEDWGSDPNRVGAVYLFDLETGDQIGKLIPDEDITGMGYGTSVTVGGNIALVTAATHNNQGSILPATVYAFDLSSGEQISKFVSDDTTGSDAFGLATATNGHLVAVGAQWDQQNGSSAGAVYVFDVLTGEKLAKIVPDDVGPHDRFGGGDIEFIDELLFVGADFENSHTGSVYIIQIPEPTSLCLLAPVGIAFICRRSSSIKTHISASISIEDGQTKF